MGDSIIIDRSINIKIFIASSVDEFRNERNALQNFIQKVSRIAEKTNLKNGVLFEIDPVRCEETDPAYCTGRNQDKFNSLLTDSDIAVFLFGKKAGDYTLEELSVAKKALENTENKLSKILICFLTPKNGEINSSIKTLEESLDSEGHYYSRFKNLDEVKLTVVSSLSSMYEEFINMKIDDGNCFINGEKVLDLSFMHNQTV